MVEHRSSAALSAFFDVTGPQVAQRSQSRRHRRVAHLQGLRGRLPAPRPPRAGPLPRHQMVLCGAHRGAPRHPAPRAPRRQAPPSTQRCSEPGSCCCGAATPSPAPTRPASTPSSTRTRGSKPAGRPYRSSTASTSPTTTKAPWRPSDGFCDLYQTGGAARVPRHRRHLHRMVRRDPGLAPPQDRASNGRIEGTNNLLQVLRAHRPRLHQPSQLRSPRTADNMTRQPVPATLHPTLTRRANRSRADGESSADRNTNGQAEPPQDTIYTTTFKSLRRRRSS